MIHDPLTFIQRVKGVGEGDFHPSIEQNCQLRILGGEKNGTTLILNCKQVKGPMSRPNHYN